MKKHQPAPFHWAHIYEGGTEVSRLPVASELSLLSFIDSAPMAVATFDDQARFTAANKFFAGLFHSKAGDFLGKKISDTALAGTGVSEVNVKQVLRTGIEMSSCNLRILSRAGVMQDFTCSFFPILSVTGQVEGVGMMVYRPVAEPALIDSSPSQIPEIAHAIFTFIGMLTTGGKIVDVNRHAIDTIKINLEQVVGVPVWDTYWWNFSKESKSKLKAAVKSAADGHTVRYETPLRMNDDTFLFIDFSIVPIKDSDGKVLYLVPSATDITAKREVEEALHISKKRFNSLLNASVVGALVNDLKGNVYDANEAFLQLLGYTHDEMEQGSIDWAKLTPRKYLKVDQEARQQFLDKGYTEPYEKEYIRKDGSSVCVVVAGALINKSTTECISIVLDITKQKESEALLRNSQERFEYIARHMVDVISIRDRGGKYIYISPMIEKITGHSPESIIGKTLWDLGGNKDSHAREDQRFKEVLLTKKPAVGEDTYEGKYYHSVMTPEFDQNGDVVTVLTVSRDITPLKEQEQRKDEFISAASHELKTPVTSLKIFNQLLERMAEKGGQDEFMQPLAKMNEQIDRLTLLINDLLDVSRIKSGRLILNSRKVDMTEIVQDAIAEVQPSRPDQAIVIEGMTRRKVDCDSGKIQQVLANLLSNAIKYSPAGKPIVIVLTEDPSGISVGVKDYGYGLNKRHHKKIFELFYRVKENDQRSYPGLGMGLYISKEIIDRHNGTIGVESVEGEGATFSFYLPRREIRRANNSENALTETTAKPQMNSKVKTRTKIVTKARAKTSTKSKG